MSKILEYIKNNCETVTDAKFDGHRIVIFADKPGHVIGRRGEKIKALAEYLQEEFLIEKPTITVKENE